MQDGDLRTTMLAISQLDSLHLHPSEAFTQSDLQFAGNRTHDLGVAHAEVSPGTQTQCMMHDVSRLQRIKQSIHVCILV